MVVRACFFCKRTGSDQNERVASRVFFLLDVQMLLCEVRSTCCHKLGQGRNLVWRGGVNTRVSIQLLTSSKSLSCSEKNRVPLQQLLRGRKDTPRVTIPPPPSPPPHARERTFFEAPRDREEMASTQHTGSRRRRLFYWVG